MPEEWNVLWNCWTLHYLGVEFWETSGQDGRGADWIYTDPIHRKCGILFSRRLMKCYRSMKTFFFFVQFCGRKWNSFHTKIKVNVSHYGLDCNLQNMRMRIDFILASWAFFKESKLLRFLNRQICLFNSLRKCQLKSAQIKVQVGPIVWWNAPVMQGMPRLNPQGYPRSSPIAQPITPPTAIPSTPI